jgi:hypothetical protein
VEEKERGRKKIPIWRTFFGVKISVWPTKAFLTDIGSRKLEEGLYLNPTK